MQQEVAQHPVEFLWHFLVWHVARSLKHHQRAVFQLPLQLMNGRGIDRAIARTPEQQGREAADFVYCLPDGRQIVLPGAQDAQQVLKAPRWSESSPVAFERAGEIRSGSP